MSRREIVYPFFLHCCRETDDRFWKFVFEDLSYGKAPYGSYFSRGFLCCSFKGREFSYRIDPYLATNLLLFEVKDVLQNRLGLRSYSDLQAQRDRFEREASQSLSACDSWVSVKRKEVKNLLLTVFVAEGPGKEACPREKRRLFATIVLAIQLKAIPSSGIHVRKGKIETIDAIEEILDPESRWMADCTRVGKASRSITRSPAQP